jgi:hypothetical protein
MLETIKKEWQAQVAVFLFVVLTFWYFISPSSSVSENGRFFCDLPIIYGIMGLWGGIWGVSISAKWGSAKSVIGKALLFFSLGLFAQVFGQVVYAYFSFVEHVEIPYPSLGDLGYFGSVPLYIYGVWMLAKASGVSINLQSFASKLQALIIPLIVLGLGYFLFLRGYEFDWTSPLRVFLDFGYPIGQAIYVAIAILTYSLTRGTLGGIMKPKILFFLFALLVQFLADYMFLIQAYYDSWSAGGWNDYIYLVAYFLMTLALIQLKTVSDGLRRA